MAFIPRSIAPFERYPNELARPRIGLAQLLDHHVPLAKLFVGSGGLFFTTDLWVLGVAQRSYHLVEGFLQAFDSWNVTVAAPLVRFQIENLVRTSYILQAEGGQELVLKLIDGGQLNRMQAWDDPKQRLTDAELVKRAGTLFPWLPDVYEASNEWVHLSSRHVFNASSLKERDGGSSIVGRIPLPIEEIPVSFLEELIGAMRQATRDLFGWFEMWEEWKASHPEAEGRLDAEGVGGTPYDL